jgi:hypothetical protein
MLHAKQDFWSVDKLNWLLQVLQILLAEQLAQLAILQVTQVPLVLTVRLLLQTEQKLLELQVVHCWTLQLTQTLPPLIGFPVVHWEQTFWVVQREQPVTLQGMQTPPEAVKPLLQVLQLLGVDTHAAQLVALHWLQVPPNWLTVNPVWQAEQKFGWEHWVQLPTLHSRQVFWELNTKPVWHWVQFIEVQAMQRISKLVHWELARARMTARIAICNSKGCWTFIYLINMSKNKLNQLNI